MGLEAVSAGCHLLSVSCRPSRPLFSVDVGADGSRTLLTRRSSDSWERSPRGLSRRSPGRASPGQASLTAGVGGGASIPGFPSRGPWSEKGTKGGPSSSSFRPEPSWSGQGVPEQSSPLGLFRWKSDGLGLIRRATRFEDFSGDRWRRPEDGICDVETSYHGFERLDLDVVNPPVQGVQDGGRAWSRVVESPRYESSGTGERENGWIGSGGEASAVDVTAPSFVRDRKFLESREHPRGGMLDRLDWSFEEDRRVDQVNSGAARPVSPQRNDAASGTSRDGGRGQAVHPAGNDPVPDSVEIAVRAECVTIPNSLRNLKKRNGRSRAGDGVCAIKKAFDSMVFMIRALQSYTLQMRKVLVSDTDVQQLLSLVHREMHSSFVWLFQQVFSCTPTLMVSVMILLANFTVFSLGNNVAIGAVVSPDPPTHLVAVFQNRVSREGTIIRMSDGQNISVVGAERSLDPSRPVSPADVGSVPDGRGFGNYGSGGIGGRSVVVAGGEEWDYSARGPSDKNAMFSERESNSVDLHSTSGQGRLTVPGDNTRPVFPPKLEQPGTREKLSSEQLSYRFLLEQTARELELKPGEPYRHVELDQETLRRLVAPVWTKMESDDYLCFDRTDLEYQHAISAEPSNPMLLANYAQFLYAVRHDNKRAENFFHRALRADSEDGDIFGRWASFLWLALKDRPRAEMAYRSAIALDPSNPFHAGSYAHFLWHAGDDDSSPCHPQ